MTWHVGVAIGKVVGRSITVLLFFSMDHRKLEGNHNFSQSVRLFVQVSSMLLLLLSFGFDTGCR